MNQYKLFSLAGIALAGTLVATTPVQAFTFSLNNIDSGVFSYDITLAANEGLAPGQPLILTNLGGVTAVDGTINPSLQFNTTNFDETFANFSVTTFVAPLSTSQLFTNVITLTSDNPTGDITYRAFSIGSGGGAPEGTAQGPVVPVSVPESSTILGSLVLLGLGLIVKRRKS